MRSISICDDYLTSHPASRDLFTPLSLSDCIISMLESGSADQNQEDLLNLLGVDAVEFVFEILSHRDALLHGDDDHAILHAMEADEEHVVSQRPLDDLGLDASYLEELTKNGLTLPNEPSGWK